jgi:hypothetical protein
MDVNDDIDEPDLEGTQSSLIDSKFPFLSESQLG